MKTVLNVTSKSLLLSFLCIVTIAGRAQSAQPADTVASDSSQLQRSKLRNDLWLMAAFSWDPIVDPQPGNPENLGGYSYIFCGSWKRQVLILAAHSARGFFEGDPLEEHRYDYSLLYGLSYRKASYSFGDHGSFFDLAIGLSYIDYIAQGNQLTHPSLTGAEDATYQQLIGISVGPTVSINYFWTASLYEGAGLGMGVGIHGVLAKNVSYFALEFSLIELHFPIRLN